MKKLLNLKSTKLRMFLVSFTVPLAVLIWKKIIAVKKMLVGHASPLVMRLVEMKIKLLESCKVLLNRLL